MSKRLEMAEAMIAKGAKDAFPFYVRAMELRSLQRNEDAHVAFKALNEKFPNYVPAYLMWSQLRAEMQEQADAAAIVERGLEVAQRAGDDHALSELRAFRATLPE